ncbi:MAG: hypothetical protein K5842_05650 [Bacteroidales bacterium]|nr:hypothetical protein [Bacteroidales bacterium]
MKTMDMSNFNANEMADALRDGRRLLERKQEEMTEKAEQLNGFLRFMDAMDELLAENDRLRTERERLQEQLIMEEERHHRLEMQLREMGKLTKSMAEKTSQKELLQALKVFVNKSKRKKLDKRIAVKEMVLELANANGLIFPKDLAATIDCLDDEEPEAKVVNIAGNYNEIHNNANVKLQ